MITRRIGVDFGTSSSVVCYRDYEAAGPEHDVEEISFQGRRYVPTLILEAGAGKDPLFGWDAHTRGRQPAYRANLRSSFKMGLLSDDARRRSEAESMAGLFFRHMRGEYERGCRYDKGHRPEEYEQETVVTCPGKFDERAREALRRAAEQAGFRSVEVLNEAEAALRFVLDSPTEDVLDAFDAAGGRLVVMLLDMGAGTSDVALYRCDGIGGDPLLLANYPTGDAAAFFGGDELDDRLCGFYERLFGDESCRLLGGGDAELGRMVLLDQVRDFKEGVLSAELNNGNVVTTVPGCLFSNCNTLDDPAAIQLDRTTFEGLLEGYLSQLSGLVEGALAEASVKAGDVGLVVLTGGHSRWYFVRDCLRKAGVAAPVVSDPAPRLVVARGAVLIREEEAVSKEVTNEVASEVKTVYEQSTSDTLWDRFVDWWHKERVIPPVVHL